MKINVIRNSCHLLTAALLLLSIHCCYCCRYSSTVCALHALFSLPSVGFRITYSWWNFPPRSISNCRSIFFFILLEWFIELAESRFTGWRFSHFFLSLPSFVRQFDLATGTRQRVEFGNDEGILEFIKMVDEKKWNRRRALRFLGIFKMTTVAMHAKSLEPQFLTAHTHNDDDGALKNVI